MRISDWSSDVCSSDLARVPGPHTRDEVGTLASAFNRMTQRLEAQTSALVNANSQLDNRRAFIEAVLSGVTAGILSVDQKGIVRLANSSARAILQHNERSEEQTSELQTLLRISYAVFCLTKKKKRY